MKNVLFSRVLFGVFSVVVVVLGAGCHKELPPVSFSASVTQGDAPLAVQFYDETGAEDSENKTTKMTVNRWSWDFGDGATSDQPSPLHIYQEPGTYTVTLTVEDTINFAVDSYTAKDFIHVDVGIDSDGDLISDSREMELGTNPNLWDGDGDGFSDGEELFFGMDPAQPEGTLQSNVRVINSINELVVVSNIPPVAETNTPGELRVQYLGDEKQAPVFTADTILLYNFAEYDSKKGIFNWDGIKKFAVKIKGVREEIINNVRTYIFETAVAGILDVFKELEDTWQSERRTLKPEEFPKQNCVLYTSKDDPCDNNNEDYNCLCFPPEVEKLLKFECVPPSCSGDITITAKKLDVSITGQFTTTIKIEDSELKYLRSYVDGAFVFYADTKTEITGQCTWGPCRLDFGSVYVPVVAIVGVDLGMSIGLEMGCGVYGSVDVGFSNNSRLVAGLEFDGSDLHAYPNDDMLVIDSNVIGPEFDFEGDAYARVTLQPRLGISLLSLASAYVEVDPYVEGRCWSDSDDWEECYLYAGVYAGIYGSLGVDVTLLSNEPRYELPVFCEMQLWPSFTGACLDEGDYGVGYCLLENRPINPGEGEVALGEEETILLPGGVPLLMVKIPGGTYQMGRYPGEQDSYDVEDPQHQVTLSQDFYLGKYELTKRQWLAVMGTTPWSAHSYVLNDLESPAVYIAWDDTQSFFTDLNTHIMNTGQGPATFRLPSEAEWEYACRAGTTTRFYWGNDLNNTVMNEYAWYASNAYNINEKYAHVVGLKLPNGFGLYDMNGNVWEWCEDDWHDNYIDAPTDGSAWTNNPRGSYLVLRGGHWGLPAEACRSASRGRYVLPVDRYCHGFRVACSVLSLAP